MGYLVVSAIALGIIIYYYGLLRFVSASSWQHYFEGFHFSAEEFYQSVEAALKEKEIEGISYGRESFQQTHILSAWREYFKISRDDIMYFVCVAPFGKGTFVSWWKCEKRSWLLHKFPSIAKLLGKNKDYLSFYQVDAASMYTHVIHNTITELLDGVADTHGKRRLTELEKSFTLIPQK